MVDENEVAAGAGRVRPALGDADAAGAGPLLRLLIERVDYDGEKGTVSVTFHPTGIKTLADELRRRQTA